MKPTLLIKLMAGALLVAMLLFGCRLNPAVQDGSTPAESRHKVIDSLVTTAYIYTKTADMLDDDVASVESPACVRMVATKLQTQLLDSAAKYHKMASILATGD